MDPVSKAQGAANSVKQEKQRGRPFQKGVSGNPSGRPKKLRITKMYEKVLNSADVRKEVEDSIQKILTGGRMASVLMLREMAERTEGKVVEVVDMNVTGRIELAEVIERRRKKRGDSQS